MLKRFVLGGGLLLAAASFITVFPGSTSAPKAAPASAPASAQPVEKDTQVDPSCTTFCCNCGCC